MSASVCVNNGVWWRGSERVKRPRERKRECGHKHVYACAAQWKTEWQHLQVESNWRQGRELCGRWDKYRLLGHTLPPPKHLGTAKFTGVTSTVSLTSNSPVYTGYSDCKHLIIVFIGASGPASFRFSLIHPYR